MKYTMFGKTSQLEIKKINYIIKNKDEEKILFIIHIHL